MRVSLGWGEESGAEAANEDVAPCMRVSRQWVRRCGAAHEGIAAMDDFDGNRSTGTKGDLLVA